MPTIKFAPPPGPDDGPFTEMAERWRKLLEPKTVARSLGRKFLPRQAVKRALRRQARVVLANANTKLVMRVGA